MVNKNLKPIPTRLSAPKPEDRKPSKIIAAFWWIVFIVPVIFVWLTTESLLFVGFLLTLRIGMMFIPALQHGGKKEQASQESQVVSQQTVNNRISVLLPYKEEAIAEWWGFLKFMRIYDRDKEEKELWNYRKFRGWE